MALTKQDIQLIGDEMIRALEPIHKDISEIKTDIKSVNGQIKELIYKVDALTADVIDLQNTIGVIKDQLVGIEEKLTKDRQDIKRLK